MRTQSTVYRGAHFGRLTEDWVTEPLSADQEALQDLFTLRARARELVRNTSWGRRYCRLLANNVVGARGIRLQGRMRQPNGLPATTQNSKLEAAWQRWSTSAQASVDRRLSWTQMQRLVISLLPQDGEFLIRLLPGFGNDFGFALQVLDADQLDETYWRAAEPGKNEIRMGVEIDTGGQPVAYHLFREHPYDWHRRRNRERERVPAAQIIHGLDADRVGRTRGIPWLANVMADVNMLRGYYEAELVQARVAAAKGGFFERTGDGALGYDIGETDEEGKPRRLTMEAEPGLFDELPPGLSFKPFVPEHPTTAFPEFTKAQLRAIASGLNVSYAALTGDLSDTSYSSIRQGALDERDAYRGWQQWLIETLHQRVYEAWVPMALLSGQLDARVELNRFFEIEWQPRGWAWVDPRNEVQAAGEALDRGLASRRRLLGEQGVDYEDVFQDLRAEDQLALELGISVRPPPKGGNAADGQPQPNGRNRMTALLGSS